MKDTNLIFEKNNNSLSSFSFSLECKEDDILAKIPDKLQRISPLCLPIMSENEVIRHYIKLSNKNYGVDNGFYPLGSCTMKYNPKINERIAKYPSFINFHPYADNSRIQGNLEILSKCKKALLEISGMDDLTHSPCAGAHGELTGLYIIKAYFKNKNEDR